MRAAVLHAFGSKLTIEDIPEPVAGPGEAVVEVLATRVLSYMDDVLSGARDYLMEPPFVPGIGCIGRIRALGPDATRLAIGDHVVCDPTVRSRDATHSPDILLQGLTAGGPGGLVLQRHFHDGSFAEAMRVPLENVVPIGRIDASEAGRWCAVLMLMVPYGGLLAGELQPGETIVVNGATGGFGSAGIAVALGMGAARIIAAGRNRSALAMLARHFGARVVPVAMTGDEAADRAAIMAAGTVDCVLDLLPPMATPAQVRAAALAVRPGGRVVLMGGLADKELALPYGWLMRNNITLRGQWMYPRDAVPRMVSMVRAGLVSLGDFDITAFPLGEVEAAIAHAADRAGPLQQTVLLLAR